MKAFVDRLAHRAASGGLTPEHLDEMVHDLKGREAAEINNGGLASQMAYLVKRLGARGASDALDEIAGELLEER